MAIIGKPGPWDESITFIILPEGEIRSLKSPLYPFRRVSVSPTGGSASPLRIKVPQQDLRRTIYELGASDIQQSISESSSISLHDDITISLYPPFSMAETSTNTIPPSTLLTGSHNHGVPEPHHEQLMKNAALQIAQSVFLQSGLKRRYWDPPLAQFHHDVEANQHLDMQDKLPKTVALVDINIAGDPIRMCTLDFDVDPRGLKIGVCLFLNLPYGANDACGLQIKMEDGTASDQPRFFLEVVAVVLATGTGKKRWRLCTRHDVTGIIMKTARKRLTLETASSSLEHPTRNLTPTVDSQSSSNSEFFDWAAFAEDELEADLYNASQPAEQHAQQHRPTSRTPFHHSAQSRFRLSGSTIVPMTCDTPDSSARFYTRSTLVAKTPTPFPTINRARHHPTTTPSPSPSLPFDAIPEDIQTFLRLADGIRRAHAGLFFILVPLRGGKYHPAIANAIHSARRRNTVGPGVAEWEHHWSRCKLGVPTLVKHSVDYVSAELRESPELLVRLVRAGNARESAVGRSLRDGLARGKVFVWEVLGKEGGREEEVGKEGWEVECVPVGNGGGERWWICFISGRAENA